MAAGSHLFVQRVEAPKPGVLGELDQLAGQQVVPATDGVVYGPTDHGALQISIFDPTIAKVRIFMYRKSIIICALQMHFCVFISIICIFSINKYLLHSHVPIGATWNFIRQLFI